MLHLSSDLELVDFLNKKRGWQNSWWYTVLSTQFVIKDSQRWDRSPSSEVSARRGKGKVFFGGYLKWFVGFPNQSTVWMKWNLSKKNHVQKMCLYFHRNRGKEGYFYLGMNRRSCPSSLAISWDWMPNEQRETDPYDIPSYWVNGDPDNGLL